MRVNTFAVNQSTGAEEPDCSNVELSTVFDPPDDEYHLAMIELSMAGRYWCGGGAGQLFLIKLIKE